MTKITIAEAKENLRALREEAESLLEHDDKQKFRKWKRSVKAAVANIFGEDSRHLEEIENIRFSPMIWSPGPGADRAFRRARISGIEQTIAFLESMEEEIENYWHEEPEDEALLGATEEGEATGDSNSRVFVVHGHDHGAKEAVARFLSKLGLDPVILHERPNQGRTLLEKIEDQEAVVDYAVVILTPDDECLTGDEESETRPRARQNVIFELGFFMAGLGRDRVAALVDESIEKPSDYDGVVYIPFAHEERRWQTDLIGELKAAGFDVDANKAFEV